MKLRKWFLAMNMMLLLSIGWMASGVQAQVGGCSTTHIVQSGETLFRIALKYQTTVADIQARNSITNPNRIYVGQQLCINGGFVPPSTVTPVPDTNQQAGSGTVTALLLNVRTGAGTQYGVIRVIRVGHVYPIVGRNSSSTWYLINVEAGLNGWVSASYMNTTNPQNLPVVNDVAEPYSANVMLVQNASLHIAPDGNQGIVPQQIASGTTVRVIGRNSAATWFQITTQNGTGWIKRDAFPNAFGGNLFPITG